MYRYYPLSSAVGVCVFFAKTQSRNTHPASGVCVTPSRCVALFFGNGTPGRKGAISFSPRVLSFPLLFFLFRRCATSLIPEYFESAGGERSAEGTSALLLFLKTPTAGCERVLNSNRGHFASPGEARLIEPVWHPQNSPRFSLGEYIIALDASSAEWALPKTARRP